MKIQYIQISNVLSFKYLNNAELDLPETRINFGAQNGKDIHILSGVINFEGKKGRTILQGLSPEKKKEVQEKIEEKYSQSLFILKYGELEDYLGKRDKSVLNVMNFCLAYDKNSLELKHKRELNKILNKIFKEQELS